VFKSDKELRIYEKGYMKLLITLFCFLSFASVNANDENFQPVNKYFHLYDKDLNPKVLKDNGYIKSHELKESKKDSLTSIQEHNLLIKIGLKEYLKNKDSLDKKIMIHRMRKYIPKRLLSYYPDIPKEALLKAQRSLR
jgi:hypothetical protein